MNSHDKLRECEERIARMRRAILREMEKVIVAKSKNPTGPYPHHILFPDKQPRKLHKGRTVTQIVGFCKVAVFQDLDYVDGQDDVPRGVVLRALPIEDLILVSRFLHRHINRME